MSAETEPPKADWTAWILQFIVGILAGAVFGFFLVMRRRSGFWMAEDLRPYFISGTALLVGALATLYGDRLWLGDSHRVIPPGEIEHNWKSKLASGVVLLGGMGMAGYALTLHFGFLP